MDVAQPKEKLKMKYLLMIFLATCTGSAFCQDTITVTADSFAPPISEEVRGFAVGRAAVVNGGENPDSG
jgi:hypothetical protein